MTLLLIGNKSDLENKREVKKEDGEEKAKAFGLGFIETSACTGDNIDKAFEIMLKEVCNKYIEEKGNNVEFENDGENLEIKNESENNANKKSCC